MKDKIEINKKFKLSSHDELVDLYPLKYVQNDETKKWNFIKKSDESCVTDICFDQVIWWGSYSCRVGDEHNLIGLDGLIYLETPYKTKGSYPYMVHAKVYHYDSDGKLTDIFDTCCGLSGI